MIVEIEQTGLVRLRPQSDTDRFYLWMIANQKPVLQVASVQMVMNYPSDEMVLSELMLKPGELKRDGEL